VVKAKPNRKKLDKELLDLFSDAVIARDNTCRYCNRDSQLSAHHIRVKQHRATRYSVENGLCLCWPCHSLQKLQPELFHDRIIEIIGQREYNRLKELSGVITNWKTDELVEIKNQLKRMVDK
jgi:nitrite reductase/ring-hydroxylating ferredoxin subunit